VYCDIPLPFAQLTTNERGGAFDPRTVSVDSNANRRQILVESSDQPVFETALPPLL
jgi:hypothetical protein